MIRAFLQRIWAALDAGASEAFERDREENRAAMRALLVEKFNRLKDVENK